MEAFFNAVLTDIVSRSVSFFMDKYYKFTTTPSAEGNRVNDLQQLLLRIRVIVEEAEGRLITNQAMVHQLNILRKEMYRGYFTIDSLRCHCTGTTNNHDVSYSFALSKFNPAKRLFLPGDGDACGMKDIQQVLDNLNRLMIHMSEFVTFLSICPPLCRQPYHMHLFIDKCMFGRQMEMDRIMGFLMQREHPSTNCVDVLPIVGPTCVGKSTLVAHVCNDARVRSYFSQIVVLNGDDIGDDNIATLKERAVFIHQSHKTVSKDQRLLVIIEFPTDVDEVAWNSLYLSFSRCLVRGSKIIITGRSNKIRKFGTTHALALNFLPPDAFWYFFKVLVFGSVDSSDHPKLESIAMEMARGLNGSFILANMGSCFLRNSMVARFWSMCLAAHRATTKRNISLFGEIQSDLVRKNKPAAYLINKNETIVCRLYRKCLANDNVPAITWYDLVSGSRKCEENSDILAWKSHIPPYKCYIATCTIDKLPDPDEHKFLEG